MDKERFIEVCTQVIHSERKMESIGTLSEKTVHSILKKYLEPDFSKHEIKVKGYVADICNGNKIIEIQTANFNKLRNKLQVFLEDYKVTIVYPVPYVKWLLWVNQDTGEISDKRKSPKKGSKYEIMRELYKIKPFLNHPNLSLKIILMNIEEYRMLDGWSKDKKKGSTRNDRFPTEIIDEINISGSEEYYKLIPEELQEGFTSKDYKKATKLTLSNAQTALNILTYTKAVQRIGKDGNLIIYKRKEKS